MGETSEMVSPTTAIGISAYAYFPVILTAIDLARMDAYKELPQGKDSPVRIVVGKGHFESVVENRKEFRDGYKGATGFYPEELAQESNLRHNTTPKL